MPWLWTDDLAHLLIEDGALTPETAAPWIARPLAFTVPDGTDPRAVARELFLGGAEASTGETKDAAPAA